MAARSADDGRTWTEQVSLNDPQRDQLVWCHPKILRDGTVVLPAYGKIGHPEHKEDIVGGPTDAVLFFSTDGGRSWSDPLLLARGIPTRTNDEPEVAELGTGDLLVMLRHANPTKVGTPAVYLPCGQIVVRKVNGRWIPGPWVSTHLGFRGFPALLRTRDGILIGAGSGNQFNFTVDDGKTWSETMFLADPKYNRHNHYPVLVEMPDGRIMSIYHVGNHWPYPPPEDQWIHATAFRLRRR
jgi:hypothetical protein